MKHSLKKLSIIALSCLFVSGCFLNDSSVTSLVPSSITESSDEPSSSSDSSSEPSSSSSSETPSSSSSSSESSSSSSSSVYENLVEEIKLANTAYSVNIGNSIVIKATVYPLYASHKDVIYESLDESIATVNEKGKVTGVKDGQTKIRVSATDGSGVFAEAKVTVNAIEVTSITVPNQNMTVNIGNKFYIDYSIIPSNASYKTIDYQIEKPNLLEVDETGYFTPLDEGTTKVILQTSNPNVKGQVNVTIKGTDLTGFSFRDDELGLHAGETYQLEPNFYPSYASFVPVTYSSSDNTVATVSENGLITAKKVGSCIISARTMYGGFSDALELVVTEDNVLNKTPLKYGFEDMFNNHAYGFSHSANEGDVKWLVVPIWFTDSSNFISSDKKSSVRSDITKAFFGSNSECGWRSVSGFYEEESFGALNISGTVTDWYPCKSAATSFGSNSGQTHNLANEVYEWVKKTYTDIDLKEYDRNKDGVLDALIMIYGCADYSVYSIGSNMWAYCSLYTVSRASLDKAPNLGTYMWASYDFMYQGDSYWSSGNAKSRTGYGYGSGNCDGITLDTHTYIHESGHLLGADDYYDYSGQYVPAGGFSMQDHDRGMHDPYSIMAYGWTNPYIPTESCELEIKSFATSGDVVLLTPYWNEFDSCFDEYILIELFTPTGVNKYDAEHYTYGKPQLSGTGVRIWHVDARLAYTSGGSFTAAQLTCNPSINGYSVYPAMTNTYYREGTDARYSVLGKNYADMNLLQQIRNYPNVNYKISGVASENDFYLTGDVFDITNKVERNQFVKTGLLNSGEELGWKVEFTSVKSTGAKLKITRV